MGREQAGTGGTGVAAADCGAVGGHIPSTTARNVDRVRRGYGARVEAVWSPRNVITDRVV
jgi:hypothetical protein